MADTNQLKNLDAFIQDVPPSAPVENGSDGVTKAETPASLLTPNGVASLVATAIPSVANAASAGVDSPPPVVLNELEQILNARKIDLANPPPCSVPIFMLGQHQICSEGNLSAISGQAKGGKTAVVGAMIACALSVDPDNDTFGFSSPVHRGGAVIQFDCELSDYDAYEGVKKLLQRAGRETQPCRLHSYSLACEPTQRRRELLRTAMQRAAETFGEVHSVFVDGVADLCVDPNDSAEAFQLVEELQILAIRYKTAVVLVLHENPGVQGFGKTRGHLGSQLERKAESNLRLVKAEDGVTEIFGEKCRHANIPKGCGPRFKYDIELAMHVSCEAAACQRGREDRESMVAMAEEAFEEKTSLKYSELKQAIMKVRLVKEGAAENWVRKLTDAGIIRKNEVGHYIKVP